MSNNEFELENCAETDRKLIAYYNQSIRRYRNLLKKHGDDEGFIAEMLRDEMQYRYEAKNNLASTKSEIATLALMSV